LATWVTHFRIAEELLKTDIPVSPIEFLVGNIGPDCGLIGEDGVPQPPKEITHFEVEGRISADSFYKQYLRDDKVTLSREFSYYLGYYIHLVTDEKWIKLLDRKKKEKVYQDILNSPEYAGLVKKDWYGLDFLYLKHHKDNIFWSEFQHITAFPEYLSFFKNGQTFEQIQNITRFYQTSSISEDHEFIYLKTDEVNDFVRKTLQEVKEGLNEKRGLLLV
jgi:hypothetical protein